MKLKYLLGFVVSLASAATAQTAQPAFRPRTVVTYTGAYSSTAKYTVNDMVTLAGVTYISTAANNVGNAVTNATWWTALTAPVAPATAVTAGSIATALQGQSGCANGSTNAYIPGSDTCTPAGGVTTSANIYAANGIAQADAVTHSTAFGLQSFGDSLTAGLGATVQANAWPNLMAAHYGITSGFVNHGTGGDRGMDMTAKVFGALNPADFGNPIVTGMAGASEAVAGTGAIGSTALTAYTKNLYAAAIWAGVSSKWKAFMQNTAQVTCSGGISTGQTNYFNSAATGIVQQSFIASASGAVQGYGNQQFGGYFTASDYMTVTAGTSYVTNMSTCNTGQSCGYSWYTSAKAYISGGGGLDQNGTVGPLTAPAGAAFFRMTYFTSETNGMFVNGTTIPTTYIAFAATPSSSAWLVENSFPNLPGAQISAAGTCTDATALVSPSGVFYLLMRSNLTDGNMHVTIDGVTATDTLTGLTSITGNWTGDNANGTTVSGAAARYVTTPGFHSIAVVWESGAIAPYAFVFPQPRTRGKSAPVYVVGGMGTSYGLTHAAPYAQIQTIALGMSKQLTADGLDTPFVDISQLDPNGFNSVAYGACPASQAPPLHGNDCINAQMAGYFEAVTNGVP